VIAEGKNNLTLWSNWWCWIVFKNLDVDIGCCFLSRCLLIIMICFHEIENFLVWIFLYIYLKIQKEKGKMLLANSWRLILSGGLNFLMGSFVCISDSLACLMSNCTIADAADKNLKTTLH